MNKKALIFIIILIVLAGGVFASQYNWGSIQSNSAQELNENDDKNTIEPEQKEKVEENDNKNKIPSKDITLKVITPNGGETYNAGQEYTISWEGENFPEGSWVWLTYTLPDIIFKGGEKGCITFSRVPASQGSFSWTPPERGMQTCSDIVIPLNPNTNFETKIKAELYTGTPACIGYPIPNHPCITGTRTLHAEDESDANITITNI